MLKNNTHKNKNTYIIIRLFKNLLSPEKYAQIVFEENNFTNALLNFIIFSIITVSIYFLEILSFLFILGFIKNANDFSFALLSLYPLLALVIMTILSLFFISFLIHLFIGMFKGNKNYKKTFICVAYSLTISLILSLIPLIGYLVGIYSVVLLTYSLSKTHKLDLGKAFLTILFSSIILVLLITIISVLTSFIIFGRLNSNLTQPIIF